jgi:F-type H+-transporting ATPase subunit delta
MSVTRIATRYAKSLLDLAIEQGKLEQVHADVNTLAAAARNRDLHLMLKSPIINPDKKNAVLKAIFEGKMDTLTLAYLNLLVNKGREGYATEIANEFIHQYKVLKKVTTVTVITAEPLSEAILAQIQAGILKSGATTENIELVTKIQPDLIGGFVLEFDNKRYDASVASKLFDLKTQFTKNLYVKEF